MASTDQYSMKLPLTIGPIGVFIRDATGHMIASTDNADTARELTHRANAYPSLVAALTNARLQIEYLHTKFQETGSGNQAIALIDAALVGGGGAK